MRVVAAEIRRLRRLLAIADRRMANTMISGKVAAVDAGARLVRLQIDEDEDGAPVLGPWVPWEEPMVGTMTMHVPLKIGQQMTYVSPSGTLGSGTTAKTRTYDDDTAAPSAATDAGVIAFGSTTLTFGAAGLTIKGGTITLEGDVKAKGGTLTHDDINVGKDHTHTGVIAGGDLTGPPAG